MDQAIFQIRQMREYTPKGQIHSQPYDAPTTPEILGPSIEDILRKLPDTIKQIPEDERYNLFCTLHQVPRNEEERRKKPWGNQPYILFDIDNVGLVDQNQDHLYREAVQEVLGIGPESLIQTFSGGGYHFIVKLKKAIVDVDFFNLNKIHYELVCHRLHETLAARDLTGELDSNVFAPNRLTRLPFTKNIKPDRTSWVRLCHMPDTLVAVDLNLAKCSGMPVVGENEQMTEKQLSYLKIDSPTVLSGCGFLEWTKTNQPLVNEPQWYAMLSIIRRLDQGEKLIHEYSKYHPTYDPVRTEQKANQAIKAYGPRTCDSIEKLWEGCKTCPHYKKVTSPITLKDQNFIATEHSGFHTLGMKGALVPEYDDLEKFYKKKHAYVNVNDEHYIWLDQFYNLMSDAKIGEFAESHFHPKCNNLKRSEFKGKVKHKELKNPDFFTVTTDRLLNLQNGVLNIDTMKLQDHSPEYGFKYCLPFEYDPKAKCPTFDQHLWDITEGDQKLQAILLEFMGYALSNDEPKAQKMLVLTGKGQNGKSTFLTVLQSLGGHGAVAVSAENLNQDFARQKLDGALFNIMEEVPAFADKNVWETIKALTTGAMMTAAKKFKDIYVFRNKAKLIMTCNEMPKGASANHGYFRRLLIVPFNAIFEGENDNVDMAWKITHEELPGVLNRVLEAYHRLVKNRYRFTYSEKSESVLEEYKLEVDSVAHWISENLVLGVEETKVPDGAPAWLAQDLAGRPCIDLTELYKDYRVFCQENGVQPVSRIKLTKRLLELVEERKRKDGTKVSDALSFSKQKLKGNYASSRRILYGATWVDSRSQVQVPH